LRKQFLNKQDIEEKEKSWLSKGYFHGIHPLNQMQKKGQSLKDQENPPEVEKHHQIEDLLICLEEIHSLHPQKQVQELFKKESDKSKHLQMWH
jgi:hypothetical protein